LFEGNQWARWRSRWSVPAVQKTHRLRTTCLHFA